MNNFYMHFPVGNVPYDARKNRVDPEGDHRRAIRELGGWNITYQSLLRADPKKSTKRLGQTGAEFYREVDQTVQELGISMARVSEAINRFFWDKKDTDAEMQKLYQVLWETHLPIYIALRKKGYVQNDLKS